MDGLAYASAVHFVWWCMQYSATVETSFEAGHLIEGHRTCGRVHGHHYRVQATALGHMQRDGTPVDMFELRQAAQALADECDGRYLNEMLPGVIPSPHGIARWFMERLLDQWPRVAEVTVWERPCCSGTVKREV
jgi:6-pyruvoyltetrahydropterin/6-carboxytetrahydropterin synthase